MSSTDIRQKVFRIPDNIVVSVGLSWDFIGAAPVDLDLSAVCFTRDGQFVDVVFFNHMFPKGTDEEALRSAFLVDPAQLPYMFLSGDSTVGGEEENQMTGRALAARRRQQRRRVLTGGRDRGDAATQSVFNRIYEEEELNDVQDVMDEAYFTGGDVYDECGELVHVAARRELNDEVLTFVMHKIPKEAEVIFLSITSYTGIDFTVLTRAKLVIHNETTNERVGVIDLKSATGSACANLGCMLVRTPESQGVDVDGGARVDFWDLRELNIRTFGYTFADVLPIMMDVLGVPENSRPDAVRTLDNYSLAKRRAGLAQQPLSDVRFGVGWSGEHDLDAFAVLLDANHQYIDHLSAKGGNLQSMRSGHVYARHSGDAVNGLNTVGDEEFIDFTAYRLPPEVHTIAVGATYMESFGADKKHASSKSIFDVPNFYLRLQNRTLEHPYSFEVDRWDAQRDFTDGQHGTQEDEEAPEDIDSAEARKAEKRRAPKATYAAADRSSQPVRAVLLGVLVKTGMIPFTAFFPNGQRDGFLTTMNVYSDMSGDDGEGDEDDEAVPLFRFVPIHQMVPVDPRQGIATVISFMQSAAAFLHKGRIGTLRDAKRPAPASKNSSANQSRKPGSSAAHSGRNTPQATTLASGENGPAPGDGPSPSTAENSALNRSGMPSSSHLLSREHNVAGWNTQTQPLTASSVAQRTTTDVATSSGWPRSGGGGGAADRSTATAATAAQVQQEDDQYFQAMSPAQFDGIWDRMNEQEKSSERYAVELRFLEVLELEPQLPQTFKCHGEAWVYGQRMVPAKGTPITAYDNRPMKTPFLLNRDQRTWDENSSAAAGVFLVHKYDRLRVTLYEFAAFGQADVDLASLDALWGSNGKDEKGCYGSTDIDLDLATGTQFGRAKVRVRVSRISMKQGLKRRQKDANRTNQRRTEAATNRAIEADKAHNENYSPCAVM